MSGRMRRRCGFEPEPGVRGWPDSLSDIDFKRVDEVCGMLAGKGTELADPLVIGKEVVRDRGGRLVFNTAKDTAKGRALARDPRVAVCVDLEQPPFAYVQVQGVAELSEDPAGLVTTATAIGARYMGADLAEEFGRRNGVPGELVVRVRPVKVIADFDVTG